MEKEYKYSQIYTIFIMHILVIGDIMLDINNISHTHRIAPEADIPIYHVEETQYKLGGAANVAKNVNQLGCSVELISVVGSDTAGKTIEELCKSNGIIYTFWRDNQRKTTQKIRIIENQQIRCRYDIEDSFPISETQSREIFEYIAHYPQKIDAILISDYNKGLITPELCKKMVEFSNEKGIYTFVDPKIKDVSKYEECFCLKPNLAEAIQMTSDENICNIFHKIYSTIRPKHIVITCGADGMYVDSEENHIQHMDNEISLVDVTGAGDVVIAVLTYLYLKHKDIWFASEGANYIAGKSVGVLGNYTLSQTDIEDFYRKTEYLHKIIYSRTRMDKIEDFSKDKMVVFTNGCFDILHSAHVQLLRFAKSRGDILVVGLNSDDSIKRLKGSSRPINDIFERSAMLAQFDFVDYIVIFAEDTPYLLLNDLRPDIIVKGGDYTKDTIVGAEFAKEVILFKYIQGKSSSLVIDKIIQTS
jgi:D-beta-D-heptose 7-phosphate kinase/D-beta-D-heptose 1-phosphate adenosyltransferase